jgi:hypothetical protein
LQAICSIAKELEENEATINSELIGTQGKTSRNWWLFNPT